MTLLGGVFIFLAYFSVFSGHTLGFGYSSGSGISEFISAEDDLLNLLLDSYNPLARPVKKANDSVLVKINIATMKVQDLDEKNQMMKMRAWLYQEWNDPQLSWKPSSYENIKDLRIPASKVWTPDIYMLNFMEETSLNPDRVSNVIVTHEGRVIYYPLTSNIKSSCSLDLSHFPFDVQTCFLLFGTWTSPITKVDLKVNNLTGDMWYEGHEWQMLSHSLTRVQHQFSDPEYGGDIGTFPMVVYKIQLQRNPVYYQHMFVTPAVFLMIVTLCSYLVPPEANERLTLGGIIVLGITVLLLMLENHLPTSVSQAPLLLRFLLYTLFMDTVAIVISVFSLNCYHRDIRRGKVPNWMRKVFLGKLSSYMCMKGAVYTELPTNDTSMLDGQNVEVNTASPRDLNVDKELTEVTELPNNTSMAINKTMDEVRRYLRILAAKSSLPEPVMSHRQVVVNEWHHVALVLDRLAFCFFTALTFFVGIIMALV